MRKLIVLGLVLAAACSHKVKQDAAPARSTDSSLGISIEPNGDIIWRSGVLIAPIKVTNHRPNYVQVYLDRCEVETQTGERRRRRVTNDTSINVSPGQTKTFKLMFGDPSVPLAEGSFRIWLWIQATDGSGLIENVPPLVVGKGNFSNPPAPYTRVTVVQDLPPPTDPPPPVPVVTGETYPCPNCAERRPKGSKTCPSCGLP
jgi:hypothetical protein